MLSWVETLHFQAQLYKRQTSARGDDPSKTQGMSETHLTLLSASSIHLIYQFPSCLFTVPGVSR